MAKRILIVEDEIPVLEVFEEFFKIIGLETKSARDGEEGWKIFQEEGPFDAYFIDVRIPKIEGLRLAHKIREKDAEGAILIVSGLLDPDLKEKISAIPKASFLKKPATFQEIREHLKRFNLIEDA